MDAANIRQGVPGQPPVQPRKSHGTNVTISRPNGANRLRAPTIMSGGRFVATVEDACPLPAQANVDGPGL